MNIFLPHVWVLPALSTHGPALSYRMDTRECEGMNFLLEFTHYSEADKACEEVNKCFTKEQLQTVSSALACVY